MKINDVAEAVEVSASTLRYWERKLDLNVPRDEFGSRTFNAEWVAYFKQVKALLEEALSWDEINRRLQQPGLPVDDQPPTPPTPPTPPAEPEPPPVPVPIVDPDEIAALKTQVAKMAKALDQTERDLKSQNKLVTGLQTDQKALQGSHNKLEKLVTGLQGQITALQAALTPLQGLQKRFWWWIIGIFVVFFFTMVAVVEGIRGNSGA